MQAADLRDELEPPFSLDRSADRGHSSRLRDLSSEVTRHQRILSTPIIDRDHVTTLRVASNVYRAEFSVTTRRADER